MIKIGITFEPPARPNEIFNNGIKQNALYLNDLLLNIGYDSYLIVPRDGVDKLKGLYGFDSNKYKYSIYEEVTKDNFDIVIQFTFQMDVSFLLELKKSKTKLVAYKCGNDYAIDMEDALHTARNDDRTPQYSYLSEHLPVFDEMWSIPQMVNTNLSYWETLYKTKAIEVPFIWSPLSIQQFEEDCVRSNIGTLKYRNKGESKKLAIFEPNINVIKWFFPALLVCENAYRLIPNKISYTYVTNIPKETEKFNLDLMNTIVKSLDIYKDKKMSVEARYNTLYFMTAHADIAVSHQWENPLNYLYLDLAWMGWPIVHNAHLCKDVGYYYEGFNYQQGGKVLKDVILNHDKNADKYIEKNRKVIDRFLPTNKKLQDHYKKLIEDLLK